MAVDTLLLPCSDHWNWPSRWVFDLDRLDAATLFVGTGSLLMLGARAGAIDRCSSRRNGAALLHHIKTELYRNPAVLSSNGGHWKGLDDLESETARWVSWFNDERLDSELDYMTPAEVEAVHYAQQSQPDAA